VIVRDKPGPLQLLFAVRGSVLPHIAPTVLGLMAFSTVLVVLDATGLPLKHVNATPFAVFGVALSLFLGFRNNAAYDRWWEARKLWGGLVADLRSFARETDTFVADDAIRRRLLHLSLAFLHLHRLNLRGQSVDAATEAALRAALANIARTPHPPCAALDLMGAEIAVAHRKGRIDGFGARALAGRLSSIALNQAGCERIGTTPLPYVYSLLIFRTSYLYCLLVPLALIEPAGWMTPVFVGIVAYVFFGLAEVTEELAHPFGDTMNALPLDAICRAVEISLAPHLGQEAPAPLQPVDYVLT
jgi:putative membrane protein